MIERPEFWQWARLRLDRENQGVLLHSQLITRVRVIRVESDINDCDIHQDRTGPLQSRDEFRGS